MIQYIQEYNQKFWQFANKYDTNNSNILRKIIHSYDVANTAFKIACKLNLDENEKYFAYLIGLLHDVGRFEQWKNYQTYNDHNSVDHGTLSKQIVSTWKYKELYLTQKQFEILLACVDFHNKFYTGKNKNILKFLEIIKNADSFSNILTTANGAQQIFVSENGYTQEIYDDFIMLKPLLKYSPKTKLDRSLMLTSCVYNLTYPFLKKEVIESNYIETIYQTFSKYLIKQDKQIYKKAIELMKKQYAGSM